MFLTTSYVFHRMRQRASCRPCVRAVTGSQSRTRSPYTVLECFVINNYLMQLYFIYLLRFSKSEWLIIYPSFYFNRVQVFWWHPWVTLRPGSSLVLAPVTGTWLAYKAPTPLYQDVVPGLQPRRRNSSLSIIHLNIQHCHKVYQAFFYMLLRESGMCQLSIVCYTSNIINF